MRYLVRPNDIPRRNIAKALPLKAISLLPSHPLRHHRIDMTKISTIVFVVAAAAFGMLHRIDAASEGLRGRAFELTPALSEQLLAAAEEQAHASDRLLDETDGSGSADIADDIDLVGALLDGLDGLDSTDGSGSGDGHGRKETVVCFWRPWGQKCYYL